MLGLVVIYVVLDFECENTYKSENNMRELFESYQDLKGWYLRKIPEVPLDGPRLMPPHIYDDCERTRKWRIYPRTRRKIENLRE